MDTIDKGDDIPLALLLSRADRFVEFDHDEVEEILNTYYDPEEKEVKKLLSMMDDDLDRDEVEDLLNAIPGGMEDLVRKYVNKLPFADKVDILELYY